MGGSSSKEKKSKPSKNTKKGKGKACCAAKGKGKKGPVQWSRTDGEGGDVTFVPGAGRPPSDDVEDLASPPQRGRSKSLRFGDFTQLGRVNRVDTFDLLPVDIAFFQEGKVEPEELCHVCSVYTGCEMLLCGVCYRVYHQGCLSKIGQWSGPRDLLATAGMWSCHQCSNLGSLLTDEEVKVILKRLETCGIRREDDIMLRDYLAYCHVSLQEDENKVLTREKAENAKRRFSQVDSDACRGRITWCQFLNIETVRMLKKRNKNALVRLLTAPEVEKARDLFRALDTDTDGRITKATAHEALDRNSRRSGYYPDETMMYIDDDLDESISWMDFLRDRAIYIIAERPCLRVSPLDQSTARRGSNRSSLAVPHSLPVTPISKGVISSVAASESVPTTPVCRLDNSAGGVAFRHSDGASQGFKPFPITPSASSNNMQSNSSSQARNSGGSLSSSSEQSAAHNNKSGATTPAKKMSGGFPLLPPPPSSSRAGSSHHAHRGSASGAVPSLPVKKSGPMDSAMYQTSASYTGHTYHDIGTAPLGASDGGGARTPPRKMSGQSEQQTNPFRRENSGSTRRSSQGDSNGSGGGQVVGKPPPMGGYGRAVAAPPYGKLVERVQKGEYRLTQTRSVHITSDSAFSPAVPTFGHVTGDTSTGRRPLSLV